MRRKNRILFVLVCWLVWAAFGPPGPTARGETWDGPKLKPTPRQEVFEFTQPPTFRRAKDAAGAPIKDRYEIAFASKGYCDVSVAIHDVKGELIRHVVSGVLGANAPAPLEANSLAQKILWDGKDDFGRYAPDPASCKARVSLGLKGIFDRLIGWHPKDTITRGRLSGLGAGPAGVFVAQFGGGYWRWLRVFNHDGSYQRTLIPFAADKWPQIKTEGKVTPQPIPDQPDAPARCGHGRFYPTDPMAAESITLAQANGCVFWGQGTYGIASGVYRIGVDGSAPMPLRGPPITTEKETGGMANIYSMAASPDGKWIYVTRLIPELPSSNPYGPLKVAGTANMINRRHAVFRIPWDGGQSVGTESFVGEVTVGGNKGGDSDNAHLNNPEDVATDAAGRVYVADCGNNRVQVFSPDGKHLKTIPVDTPHKVGVHHKTGEVYVMSYPWSPARQAWLCKFAALPDCRPLARTEIRLTVGPERVSEGDHDEWGPDRRSMGAFDQACFALDSWAEPVQAWIAVGDQITRWADRGDKFELLENLEETVRRDGYSPNALSQGTKMARCRLTADRIRGHLYYGAPGRTLLRCDPEVGKAWERIQTPLILDDFQLGYDGLLYVRDVKAVARLDPTVITPGGEAPMFTGEIPFDYGEVLTDGYDGVRVFAPSKKLQGVVRLPALPPGNGFNMGFGVNHLGHLVALCINYHQAFKPADSRKDSVGAWMPPPDNRYRPTIFPGRAFQQGQVVFVYDEKGQVIGEDVVKATNTMAAGIKIDGDDNVYVALAAFPVVDGKVMVSACGGPNGPGAVLKFPLTGGKIYGTWGNPVQLDQLPDRPPEYISAYGGPASQFNGAKIWTQNLLWSYAGLGTQKNCSPCVCPASRFDVDVYGRCFVPESWRFSVGVCDANGNPVLHIGRYGNADSGRGPGSPVPVPGDIAFSTSDYVCTVSDRWLYVNDIGNSRIVRVKLGYHAEQMTPLD